MASIPGKSSRLYVLSGAPVDGTSGSFAGIAPKGAVLITDEAAAYQNTNTLASPTWSAFPAASGELAAVLAAIPTSAVADVAATNATSTTAAVTATDGAAAAGSAPTKAEYDVVVTLANSLKAQFNSLRTEYIAAVTLINEEKAKLNSALADLRTAGIVTP